MNKVINIRLGYFLLAADEDAFQLLSDYIKALKSRLAQDPAASEIVSDIEERMGELLQSKLQASKKPTVELQDAKAVIEQMGSPSDVGGEEQSTQNQENLRTDSPTQKRLYRDPDNKILGGVCGGLGAYFNVDPVWIRLTLAATMFFFGTGFLIYIILWVVIPMARNHAEKLMMRGEIPNLRNIENRIKNEAEEVEQRFKSNNTAKQVGGAIGSFFEWFFDFLRKIFYWLGSLLRILIIVFGVVLISVLVAGFIHIEEGQLYLCGTPGIHAVLSGFGALWLVKSVILLSLALPVLIAGISLAFRVGKRKAHSAVTGSLSIVLGMVLLTMGILIARAIKNNHERASHQWSKTFNISGDTLLLSSTGFRSDDEKQGLFLKNEWSVRVSEDSLFHLEQYNIARGSSGFEARAEAQAIPVQYSISEQKLTLLEGRWMPIQQDIHPSSVRMVLYVPKGKFLKTSPDFGDGLSNHSEIYQEGSMYRVGDFGIDPIDSKATEIGMGRTFESIHIHGNFKVEIVQGSSCKVWAVSGPITNHHKWVDIQGGNLTIDPDNHWSDNWKRSIVRIEVPSLSKINSSGKVEYYLSHLKSPRVVMDFSGDWLVEGKVDIGRLDIDGSGIGKVDLEGMVGLWKLDLSGMGEVEAQKLSVDELMIDMSGSTHAKIKVEKSVTGALSGASRLVMFGKPEKQDLDVSGAAKIDQQF